jgi:hypothetical protein
MSNRDGVKDTILKLSGLEIERVSITNSCKILAKSHIGRFPTLVFLEYYAIAAGIKIYISSGYRTEGSHITDRESDIWFVVRYPDHGQTRMQLKALIDFYKLYKIMNAYSIRVGHYLDLEHVTDKNHYMTGDKIIENSIAKYGSVNLDYIASTYLPAGGKMDGGLHFAIADPAFAPVVKYKSNQVNTNWGRDTHSRTNKRFFYELQNMEFGNLTSMALREVVKKTASTCKLLNPNSNISLKG